MKMEIVLHKDNNVISVGFNQKDVSFELQPNGDGIVTFPDGNNYAKLTINKENIKLS